MGGRAYIKGWDGGESILCREGRGRGLNVGDREGIEGRGWGEGGR